MLKSYITIAGLKISINFATENVLLNNFISNEDKGKQRNSFFDDNHLPTSEIGTS